MTTTMFHKAIYAMQKGGLSKADAELVLTDAVNEMMDLADQCMEPESISITDREYDLFMDIRKGLVAGGMGDGAAILLIAMYAAAIQERIEMR